MTRGLRIFTLVLVGSVFPIVLHAATGSVSSVHKYAWSDQVGYINFENVVVGDSTVSGYAWSANAGWINFAPIQGGVTNDGTGNLSGYAWGEQLGWIDFENVAIDSDGRFSGTATGDLVGTLTFDCSNYCDVETSWRPVAGASSSGTVSHNRTKTPPPVTTPSGTSILQFPVFPDQKTKEVFQDTSQGSVRITVPDVEFFTDIQFNIIEVFSPLSAQYLIKIESRLVGNTVFEVTATDQFGNLIHEFPYPITITLPIPESLSGAEGLGVYWFNEENNAWVLIPDAVFSDTSVSFTVSHLTRFGIFVFQKSDGNATTSFQVSEAPNKSAWGVLIFLLTIAIFSWILQRRRRKEPLNA